MKISISTRRWAMAEDMGYSPTTTLWEDFCIAERFGIGAIRSTYRRGFAFAMRSGYKEVTELVMVLNHKVWEWCERDATIASVYDRLWREADKWACGNLKGDELDYFYSTTD